MNLSLQREAFTWKAKTHLDAYPKGCASKLLDSQIPVPSKQSPAHKDTLLTTAEICKNQKAEHSICQADLGMAMGDSQSCQSHKKPTLYTLTMIGCQEKAQEEEQGEVTYLAQGSSQFWQKLNSQDCPKGNRGESQKPTLLSTPHLVNAEVCALGLAIAGPGRGSSTTREVKAE